MTSFNVAAQHQGAHQQAEHFSADGQGDPVGFNFDVPGMASFTSESHYTTSQTPNAQNSQPQVPGGPPQGNEGNRVSETYDNLMDRILTSLHKEEDFKAFTAKSFTVETLPKYPPPKKYCK